MKLKGAVLLLFILNSILAHSQRTCAAMEQLEDQILMDPTLKQSMDKIEKHTQKYIEHTLNRSIVEGIITIPVVVHIVYNHAGENISDEQIQTQLDVLNDDFRRFNLDADNEWTQAADVEIEFCLATRDKYGDAHCGITRTQTDSTKFYGKIGMKFDASSGQNAWPYDDYLNIWVCDLSGLLGFATFPGGVNLDLDGVVCDYKAFGTIGDLKPDFNLGRTAVHEVGHWLNLRHIWGDGDCFDDDFVSDTPVSDDYNEGCETGHVSCGSIDMVQNYMDYSNDACMNLFTQGQKSRMRALFSPGGFRESLISSEGCSLPKEGNFLFITFNFDAYAADITWSIVDDSNTVVDSVGPYASSLSNTSITEEFFLPDGVYTFTIYDSYGDGLCCNEGAGSYEIFNDYGNVYDTPLFLASIQSFQFTLDDHYYRFIGPGTDWNEPENWNKNSVPSECYQNKIFIESDCMIYQPLNIKAPIELNVQSGAILHVNE